MTTIGWPGKQNLQATAMVLLSLSFTTVEWKPFLMTLIGWKVLSCHRMVIMLNIPVINVKSILVLKFCLWCLLTL